MENVERAGPVHHLMILSFRIAGSPPLSAEWVINLDIEKTQVQL
jgi:hypothetical protein